MGQPEKSDKTAQSVHKGDRRAVEKNPSVTALCHSPDKQVKNPAEMGVVIVIRQAQ